jgi:putative hemolysin
MDNPWVSAAVILAFILLGGYFSASELALVSLRDSQVQRMAGTGRRGARVAALREDSNRFLAAVQIGVTLAGFLSAAFGGSTLAVKLTPVLTGWGLPTGPASTVSLVLVTAVISYVSLVLGELVPKRVALQKAEVISLFVAPVLERVAAAARPVIWLLSRSTNAVVRLFGLDPHAGGEQVTEEELRDLVSTHQDLTADERRVLSDVFAATDRRLSEVMVPRADVMFLSGATPLAEAARQVMSSPHSRYPVTGDDVDDVLGFVHVRDLLTAVCVEPPESRSTVADVVRPVVALPGTNALLPTLMLLRRGGGHLALVVDEYGGTDGIVTLEDLIEELVGEIQDEYDLPVTSSDGDRGRAQEVPANLHADEVAERLGLELPPDRYETLGGFIMHRLGRIPAVGDFVDELNHRFTVTKVDGRRPVSVRVTPVPELPASDGAET